MIARVVWIDAPASWHQVNRIAISQLPSPCVLINKVKQAAKIDFSFRCQGK